MENIAQSGIKMRNAKLENFFHTYGHLLLFKQSASGEKYQLQTKERTWWPWINFLPVNKMHVFQVLAALGYIHTNVDHVRQP